MKLRHWSLAWTLTLIAIQAVSQAPVQAPAPRLIDATNSGVVEGTVATPGVNPEPISGVQVQLNIAQAVRAAGRNPDVTVLDATTDDAGHFEFKNLYPGRYQLRYQRDGYFVAPIGSPVQINGAVDPRQAAGRGRGAAAPIAAAANVAVQSTIAFILDNAQPVTLSIPMIPGGVISGRITDANGRPVTAGQVSALRLNYQDGHRVLSSTKSSTTNDRGEFRLFGLEPGEYYVRSDFRRTSAGRGGLQENSRIYFPGVADPDRAAKIPVASGAESSGANFSAQATPTVKISGIVMNRVPGMATPPPAQSAPATGAIDIASLLGQQIAAAPSFFLMSRDPSAVGDAPLQLQNSVTATAERAQGKFESSGVQPGHYELYALVRQQVANSTAQYGGHVSIDVGAQDVSGITLSIEPASEVRARFVTNGDATLQNQIPTALQLRARDFVPPVMRSAQQSTPANAGDNWHIYKPILPGPFVLESQLANLRDAYVADIRQGDKSIYETGTIDVGAGGSETVEIVLARPAGSISGMVQNTSGKTVAGATVTLIPDGARRENPLLYKRSTTDASGQFNLSALAPGEYKLFSWESIPAGAEMNAEFIKQFEERGVPVKVEAGAQLKTQLPLIPSKF